jgi:hypothetical protein
MGAGAIGGGVRRTMRLDGDEGGLDDGVELDARSFSPRQFVPSMCFQGMLSMMFSPSLSLLSHSQREFECRGGGGADGEAYRFNRL